MATLNPEQLHLLHNATSLELYQLSLTIQQLLEDPQRMAGIRRQLSLGAPVAFFHHDSHQLTAGRVVQFRPNDVAIQEGNSRTQWWLPYAAVLPVPAPGPAPAPAPQ